jgi:hypothetical protein
LKNETAKIPSFQNLFPELNHNEMQSYDFIDSTNELSDKFAFVILHDSQDHPRVELRMKTVEELYQEKGFDVFSLYLEGDTIIEKVFKSIILVNWIALSMSEKYGTEPEDVALIEEFKRRII